MEDNQKDLVVYLLVRTDLPSLNPGKAMSQCHHAGVQMVGKHGNRKLVKDYIHNGRLQGAVYFNTTIVLGATIDDIARCGKAAENAGEDVTVFNTIEDPSYPFFVESMEIANLIPQDDRIKIIKTTDNGRVLMERPEITCAWYLGDRNNLEFKSIFNGLNLYP